MLRRIGVLGDVHAEDELLFTALTALRASSVDAILAVGDLVDGHGDADRTCALLCDASVQSVRGNHDRWFLREERRDLEVVTEDLGDGSRRWLATLPTTRRFQSALGGVLLCHGVGDDDMAVLRSDTDEHELGWLPTLDALKADPTVQVMIAGHTHERMVRRLEGLTVVNAGTLHRHYAPGFLVVDFAARIVEAFDLDDGVARAAETYAL